MKIITLLFISLFMLQSSFAQELDISKNHEDFEIIQNQEDINRIKIKDIKEFLKTINPETTCMDEYLKRRKQMIVKLALSPVIIPGGTALSLLAGGAVGTGAAYVVGVYDAWASLGFVIGGAMIGTAAGVILTGVDATVSTIRFIDNDLILKAIAEYYMVDEGKSLPKLYQKVFKKDPTPISLKEFEKALIELDSNGSLCNGSMVKQPRVRTGPKLKYKVAKVKDFKKYFSSNLH